jgi:type I phosphodiesterase/nucleotide pyrophosphatase
MSHALLRGAVAALFAAGGPLAARGPAQAPPAASAGRPRLVVVIVVDQLRADHLDRFRPFIGPSGFNLFFRQGAHFPSARYEHAITETCPGHAVILTGGYGMVNGIVANEWYDTRLGRPVYCVEDSSAALVGAVGPGRSPRNLIGATVGDVLKTATAGRSRVVAVSGKDRSAIMLGGKLADAAWWLVDTTFVTSTYYRPDLPEWVKAFNASGAISRHFGTRWDRLLPAAAYAGMGRDDEPSEADVAGMGRSFPHPLRTREAFDQSPFLDEVVAEFAMRAVSAEGLGRDTVPDILAVGLSATDYVGHVFGPDSHEIMDDVVRLDRTLARLFGFLDRTLGLANVTLVLTADHGVAPMPEVAVRGRPGAGPGRLNPAVVDSAASEALAARFGPAPAPGWIAYDGAPLLYLSRAAIAARHVPLDDAEAVAQAGVRAVPGVHAVLTGAELTRLRDAAVAGGPASDVVRSFYPPRGGDLYYLLEPYWLPTKQSTGTGHGSIWRYDQEVPLLWFGRGIVPGAHTGPATVADIAPTLSALLGLVAPGGAQGRVLSEVLR